MWNPFRPPPAAPKFGSHTVIPELQSSWLSRLTFNWLSPLLYVGFTRPLEADDLWQLGEFNKSGRTAEKIEKHFYAKAEQLKAQSNSKDNDHNIDVSTEKETSSKEQTSNGKEQSKKETNKKAKKVKNASLLKTLHSIFFRRIWTAGMLKLCADSLKTTTPLINKALLNWLSEAYFYNKGIVSTPPRGIGYGFGLAIALFAMQEVSSLLTNHFMMLAMTTGLTIRAGVISTIFRKALRLSPASRTEHSVGKITTMISTDSARLDFVSVFVHNLWIAPIQIAVGIGLLIGNLGVSALVGLAVLVLSFPIQGILVRTMFKQRKKGVVLTDKRVRLTSEVLQGIRLLKFYAWEGFYASKVGDYRERELRTIRVMAFSRASMISVITMVPITAAILSFITYALLGHQLTAGTIFSSLQLFNIIRMPLAFLPLVFAAASDAVVALGRISKFMMAEELQEPFKINENSEWDVEVQNGSFEWEAPLPEDPSSKKGLKGKGEGHSKNGKKKKSFQAEKKGAKDVLPRHSIGSSTVVETETATTPSTPPEPEKPFALENINLRIPKGSFVAIVGRVGTGKSSLMNSLIGEMRKTGGEVILGGTVAYVPQSSWIMNATLRDNVLFGQEDDEAKFQQIVDACCLGPDIEMLPNGDSTEIGEKGINLSGGQKARVSLARAAYSPSDIILLDDCLSAVDAHVGKNIIDNCLLSGPLSKRTRILVTHALHVLPLVDYIYVFSDGKVVEEGTYEHLMSDSASQEEKKGIFRELIDEYGSLEKTGDEKLDPNAVPALTSESGAAPTPAIEALKKGPAVSNLMTAEERNTGAVTGAIYAKYLRAAGGIAWAPFILSLLVAAQGAQVGNNLFLGFWTSNSIHNFRQGDYMGVYAALGVAQAIFTFMTSFSFSLLGLRASLALFKMALNGVLRSPISFFDTTPMGRILSRLSKDQDTLDTQLAQSAFQVFSTSSQVLGTVFLVFYTFPPLGAIFVPLSILYYIVSIFYRRTSVEVKRLDSILRSALYASYSEALTGLSTVRAYRDQGRFIKNAQDGVDGENRAYYMTVAVQRWLSVRLDVLGNFLILGITFFAVGFRKTVDPSKIGVVLSYTLSITQVFSDMVSQYAMMEQNMNGAERILVYSELPAEGIRSTPNDPPPPWPQGSIRFKSVGMAYREGLPLVLKDVSFEVRQGEKVGIVGRTGAGKSSLLQALFRIVELQEGKIEIDGVNIRDIGLDTLRERLALVPQDPVLFLGTLRENLDPLKTRTDAEIITALQRAWLLPQDGFSDPAIEAKFGLDAQVADEGSNFSAGERQLIALCRALVKGSKIIVLDEASSSVDVETDAKVQKTIQKEFVDSTLLCIAHRLNTIVYYDRVLVMDGGRVAELDTPLNLFDKEDSIFRSLCDEAGLSRQDIVRIRSGSKVEEILDEEKMEHLTEDTEDTKE